MVVVSSPVFLLSPREVEMGPYNMPTFNNNNTICLKSNIQTSSVDCAPRELTHACSRSDTEACDMCYVFNVNFDGFF